MIRRFEISDTEAIIKIWLDASIIAHNFMDANYWRGKADDMRNIYLPSATTYVYEDSRKILGFIAMVDNYIAAVFVLPNYKGKALACN
mgnify:CR=1 FL=1